MAQDQLWVLPLCAQGLPPGSAAPSLGLTAPGTRLFSLPEVPDLSPDVPSWHGWVQLWGGSHRHCRDPWAASWQSGVIPQPRVCQGEQEVPHTGMAWPCPSWMFGWDGQGEARRWKLWEAMWMCPGDRQRYSLIPGGLPGTQHPAALLCTSLERAMFKGSQRNPWWEGRRRGALETPSPGCLPVGPSPFGGVPPCPAAPPAPTAAQLCSWGVVALSLHPKLTVNFPNKGQFLHIGVSLLPHVGSHKVHGVGGECSGGSLGSQNLPWGKPGTFRLYLGIWGSLLGCS